MISEGVNSISRYPTEKAPFGMTAFLVRSAADRADLIIRCIDHKSGGAYQTIKYTEKLGKKIFNIADDTKE